MATGPGGGLKREGIVGTFRGGRAGFRGGVVRPTCSGTGSVLDMRYTARTFGQLTLPLAGVVATGDLPFPNSLDVLSAKDEGG